MISTNVCLLNEKVKLDKIIGTKVLKQKDY